MFRKSFVVFLRSVSENNTSLRTFLLYTPYFLTRSLTPYHYANYGTNQRRLG